MHGLNQYTQSGTITPIYDVKGNLASASTPTYTYSTKNELIQRVDGANMVPFYHDPLGRLDSILSPAGNQGWQYADGQIANEFGDGAGFPITRRYVFGPGVDEPVVWYEGSNLADRRYLIADERGGPCREGGCILPLGA